MLAYIQPIGIQPIANIDMKSGSVTDMSYKNRTISTTSVPLGTGQFGDSNGCREFTSNASQITISDLANEIVTGYNAGNGFTIINNIKFDYTAGGPIYGRPGYSNSGFIVFCSSPGPASYTLYLLRGSANFIDTTCRLDSSDTPQNTWFQMALTLKKGAYKWTQNGSEYKGADTTENLTTAGSNQLNIGTLGGGWNSSQKMYIADFKVYPKVLSINEINVLEKQKGRIVK